MATGFFHYFNYHRQLDDAKKTRIFYVLYFDLLVYSLYGNRLTAVITLNKASVDSYQMNPHPSLSLNEWFLS